MVNSGWSGGQHEVKFDFSLSQFLKHILAQISEKYFKHLHI